MARPTRQSQLQDPAVDGCDERVVHIEAVSAARRTMPSSDETATMSAMFAAFADPTRLRMLLALTDGALCVNDLAAVVGQSESAVSHQLRVLRDLRLVRGTREGRHVYYALDDDHVTTLLQQARHHAGEFEEQR